MGGLKLGADDGMGWDGRELGRGSLSVNQRVTIPYPSTQSWGGFGHHPYCPVARKRENEEGSEMGKLTMTRWMIRARGVKRSHRRRDGRPAS